MNMFRSKRSPQIGEFREKMYFLWFPARVSDGSLHWLEWVVAIQRFTIERDRKGQLIDIVWKNVRLDRYEPVKHEED